MPNGQHGPAPKLAKEISIQIENKFVAGRKPNSRLPTILVLSRLYNVSKDTIKASLELLKNRNAVVQHRGSGAVVAQSSYDAWQKLVGKQIALSFANSNAYWQENLLQRIVSGLYREMYQTGLNLTLATRNWKWRSDDVPQRHFSSREMLGVFLLGQHTDEVITLHQELKRKVLIGIDCDITPYGLTSFCFNDYEAGEFLARRLFKLGHRRVVAIHEDAQKASDKCDAAWTRRKEGFYASWQSQSGADPLPLKLMQRGSPTDEKQASLEKLRQLLSRPTTHRPTAVFAPSLGWAQSVKEVGTEFGLQCPKDFTIVTCYEKHDHNPSKISGICFDGFELGREAARYMLQVVRNTKMKRHKPKLNLCKGVYQSLATHGRAPSSTKQAKK